MLISETKSKFMLLIFSILKPAPEIFCGKKRKELDKKKKQKEKDKTNRRKRQRKSIRIFFVVYILIRKRKGVDLDGWKSGEGVRGIG